MSDESCQVVEDDGQVYLCLNERPMDDVLPDVVTVLIDRVQRPRQAVVVELFRWHVQRVDQHGSGQPIRHAIERSGSHQAVEDQDHSHRAVIYFGPRRAAAWGDSASFSIQFSGMVHSGRKTPLQIR